ncbi:MAG: glycine zipper 2TM domain-containing protein [Rhodospirillales bacterium]|nr:glycine zipper 2TM domain-containing protein [Rhodospirillales bacterium]
MTSTKILAVMLSIFLVGACSSFQDRPNQTAGGVLGAVAGGLIGAQFGSGSGQLAATALGTLAGAWAGSEIGRSMDEKDRQYSGQAHQQALASGQTIRWNNPDSGNYGTVQPGRSGTHGSSGAYCREFQTTIVVDGEREQAYGTACQQPNGSWRIMK